MPLLRSARFIIPLSALLVMLLAAVTGRVNGPQLAARLAQQAPAAIASAGGADRVAASFVSPGGMPSRHPLLSGGESLDEGTRAAVARAVAAIPGVGGVRWADGDALVESEEAALRPLHCQEDVSALLRARTIRFEESSARIDRSSQGLIDEVATALRPCLGAIILISGHTDSSGPEPGNLALSSERAEAVREALTARGIPADGLRTRGLGSSTPVDGLAATDPANRRIEFSVIATETITPQPIDRPGPR